MGQTVHKIRLTIAVILYEIPQRILSLLNPRTYLRSRRILGRSHGRRAFPDGKYAIFVIWQRGSIPWYVENALAALGELGINVLAISNRRLTPAQREFLAERCWRVLERDNTGRDFGAYQDGVLELAAVPVTRLIFLNDSVYFFPTGLTRFFAALATEDPVVVAAHESFERTYHLQSYALSFPAEALTAERFREFWSAYRPISTRRYCIHKGEMGLSVMIRRLSIPVRVLNSAAALRDAMQNVDVTELYRARSMFSVFVRGAFLGGDSATHSHYAARDDFVQEWLLERVMTCAAIGSPIHGAGFLFIKYMGSPLLKRDLYYRTQFYLNELVWLIYEVCGSEHADEIINEFRWRGSYNELSLWQRLKFAAGII